MIRASVLRLTSKGVSGMLQAWMTYGMRGALVTALVLAIVIGGSTPPASAVSMPGAASVTVTPDYAGAAATYEIARFRVSNGETVTGYTLTFPVGTDASGAASPGNTVTVGGDGRTVTVTYGTPIVGPQNNVSLIINNVRNPLLAGSYSITQVIFHRTAGDQTLTLGTGGAYTIAPAPYLMMTITTPDGDQSVEFGAIDPGATTGGKNVRLQITSSAQYTITRAVTGGGSLGLEVSGVPVGTPQPATVATPATFTDTFTLTPPWTTDPGVPLVATVVYTVTQ